MRLDIETEVTPLMAVVVAAKSSLLPSNHHHHHYESLKRYIPLIICILLGLVSGSLYGFGRYSRDLKNRLQLSQIEMEALGVLLDVGNYIGHPIIGYIYDHFGSRITCFLAAILVFISYGMIHLRVAILHEPHDDGNDGEDYHLLYQQEESLLSSTYPPIVHNWFLLGGSFFLVGMGSGLGYMAALGSTTKMFSPVVGLDDHPAAGNDDGNHKQRRSLAIGIVAAGYGLSSTLVGISYSKVGIDHFFLLWAILVAIVNILGALVLPNNASGSGHHGHLVEDDVKKFLPKPSNWHENDCSSSHSSTTSSCTMTDEEIALQPLHHHRNDQNEQRRERQQQDISLLSYQTMNTHNPPGPSSTSSVSSSSSTSLVSSDDDKELIWIVQQTGWQSWKSFDFWLLFLGFCGCTGCGLFIINNISTMVESLGGPDHLVGQLVIVLSVCNCLGRIGMGLVADRGPSKLTLFTVSSGIMAIGMLLSTMAPNNQYALTCLVGTVILVAFAYGGTWVLIVGILADWFGQDHFGKNYGVMAMGPALSGMAFNALSAWRYSQAAILEEVELQHGGGEVVPTSSELCLGTSCYQGTFFLTACAAITCSMILFPFLKWRRQRAALS